MIEFKRVGKADLFDRLGEWDQVITRRVLVVACGGTALTLKGHKPSTKDIDFVVPRISEYEHLLAALRTKLNYKDTDSGFRDPSGVYRFDLFRGNMVFQTELLDPVDRQDQHQVVHTGKRLIVGVLNSYDLVISKMFRGDDVDVQDSIVMITAETLDLRLLANRYLETAQYYYNEAQCKQKLVYLIDELKRQKLEYRPLEEMLESWNPM